MENFTALVSANQGAREVQEDAADVFFGKDVLLAVVCDGAGGHRSGEKASQMAVQCARDAFDKLPGPPDNPEKWLEEICITAHRKIQEIGENPKLAPRTTIVLLLITKTHAITAHLGDSRIYHLRDGKILNRTRDHSMVQILFEQGEVGEDEMGEHPDQGRLLRALGTEEDPKVSIRSERRNQGDSFLLCTDGFWERLRRSEIEQMAAGHVTQNDLDGMLDIAVTRNGPKGDNTTAVWITPKDRPVVEEKVESLRLGLVLAILIILVLLLALTWAALRFLPEIL